MSFEDPDTMGKKHTTFTHATGEKNRAGTCTLAQLLQQLQDQQQKIKLRDKTCLDFYTADLVASWPARCCPLPLRNVGFRSKPSSSDNAQITLHHLWVSPSWNRSSQIYPKRFSLFLLNVSWNVNFSQQKQKGRLWLSRVWDSATKLAPKSSSARNLKNAPSFAQTCSPF